MALTPGRHLNIISTNAVILLMETLYTHLSEILNKIHTFSFMKMFLKTSPEKWRQFFLGLIVIASIA